MIDRAADVIGCWLLADETLPASLSRRLGRGAGNSSTRTGIRLSVADASISLVRSGQGGTGLSGTSGS